MSSIYGVFGLCLGGSVITILELVYYITINFLSTYLEKPYSNRKNKKQLIANERKIEKISVIENRDYWASHNERRW